MWVAKTLLFLAIVATANCAGHMNTEDTMNIFQLAQADPNFSTIVAGIEAAELVDMFSGPGPFTVFVPSNEAFAKLEERAPGTLATLLSPENISDLQLVIKYGVVPGKFNAADVAGKDGWFDTAADIKLRVNGEESSVVFVGSDGAQVVDADIGASNGVLHVIDNILIPYQLKSDIVDLASEFDVDGVKQFQNLVAGVTAAGLTDLLKGDGPFTVFAPKDSAFTKLSAGTVEDLLKPENKDILTNLIKYHVVSGKVMSYDLDGLTMVESAFESSPLIINAELGEINHVAISEADLEASNGVIHIIEEVMFPPSMLGSIADLAAGFPDFSTLRAAVSAAGLLTTLNGTGPFTLFAPTNEAFAALPAGLVTALLLPENMDHLKSILTYHVLGSEVMGPTVVGKKLDVTTVNGATLEVDATGDDAMVGDAKIIVFDIMAKNGMVHTINKVLVPPGMDVAAILASAPTTAPDATPATDSGASVPMITAGVVLSFVVALL